VVNLRSTGIYTENKALLFITIHPTCYSWLSIQHAIHDYLSNPNTLSMYKSICALLHHHVIL